MMADYEILSSVFKFIVKSTKSSEETLEPEKI